MEQVEHIKIDSGPGMGHRPSIMLEAFNAKNERSSKFFHPVATMMNNLCLTPNFLNEKQNKNPSGPDPSLKIKKISIDRN